MATILITGANRGIGLEFANQYLARGESVIATCRDPEQAAALQALQASHPSLRIQQLDVSSDDSLHRFAAGLGGEAIDVFINNAGVYGPRSAGFGQVSEQDWLPVLRVNTVAPLIITQLLVDNFRHGQARKLVYVTSKMGSIEDNQSGGSYIYRSSKTALNQVVRSLAADLADDGLTAVVIHPGWVQTDMGGPNALIDAQTSVRGMVAVIDGLGTKDSGKFYNYDGNEIPW
ncbi:MAG: SDR family oxidoreductase [Gammaproteobacteria bacterium]|jgi:NAD(P)-dependent dehydrogenase (short-subunit alcohol dehydrogenase family)